jgi:integrase
MPSKRSASSAREAVAGFISDLAQQGFATSTRRVREHFLGEYLRHAQQAAGTSALTAGELADTTRAMAWLTDAADGKTRTRNTLRGPTAGAYSNSMRVRVDTFNAFTEYLGEPAKIDSPPPASGDFLTPDESEELLRNLAVRRPMHANAVTSLRTAAVAALVADTGRSVPELAGLTLTALHLDDTPHIDLDDEPHPLRPDTVQVLKRWLRARAAIIEELDGSDPGHLWIPTKPGRPRWGQPPVKPGLTPAAVRTLHHAHRVLVSQVLGAPLRPGALRGTHDLIEPGTDDPGPRYDNGG